MATIHLIGVPLDLGSGRRGVDMGPSAVRIAGLGEQLTSLGHAVVDRGNVAVPIPEHLTPADPTKKFITPIAEACRNLHALAFDALRAGGLPLVIGGDHSLAAGSVSATARWLRESQGQPLGVIWVDAHGDMNTPQSTTSGNVHGMPLAALLGSEPHELATVGGDAPAIRPEHTVLIGIRNLDEREKDRIRAAGVHVLTMKDIDREGMAAVAAQAIELAGTGTGGIHVSFDLDVCDPSLAPGVGTPVKGGLNYREAHLIMEMVADSGRLRALDLVEINPTLDIRNTTAELATELALSALGKRIL
jgi:arginase